MTQKTTVRFPQVKIVLRFGKLKLMTNRSKLQYRANFGKILIFPELRTRPSFLRPRQKMFKSSWLCLQMLQQFWNNTQKSYFCF